MLTADPVRVGIREDLPKDCEWHMARYETMLPPDQAVHLSISAVRIRVDDGSRWLFAKEDIDDAPWKSRLDHRRQ
jgi:hypothetical protein